MTRTDKENRRILVVSDGTGETAAQITKAAIKQFQDHEAYLVRFKSIRTESQIEAIFAEPEIQKSLIVFTIVSQELRSLLIKRSIEKGTPTVDLLGPLLKGLTEFFGFEPKSIAGLLHDVNEEYFQRIEAMEYTIDHDDGKNMSKLDEADLILVGISRTSKTPLSMYLSTLGWKVVNIPMIKGFELPQELFEADQRRIVALTIDAHSLLVIRRARLQRLGQEEGGDYADPDKVLEEIEYANEIFRRNRRWPVINVTGKALEETASEISKLMASRRLTPQHYLENIPQNK